MGIRDINAVSSLHKHGKEKKIAARLSLFIPSTATNSKKKLLPNLNVQKFMNEDWRVLRD